MRIIADTKRGLILQSFEHEGIRPTKDAVKESMFNSLSNYLNFDGIAVADLFAGTGSLGIEALSRGARDATFVEKNAEAVTILNRNLQRSGFCDQAQVQKVDVLEFLNLKKKNSS